MTNHAYNLHGYRYSDRLRRYVETDEIVTASDAIEAVKGAAARDYPLSGYASLTSRFGRDPDAAVRDNAHIQINGDGTIGFSATRVDAAAHLAILYAMTPEEHLAYLASCPAAESADALSVAGYSAHA